MSRAAQEWQLCLSSQTGNASPVTTRLSLQWLGREKRSNILGSSLLLPLWLKGEIGTFLVQPAATHFISGRLDLGYKVLGVFM